MPSYFLPVRVPRRIYYAHTSKHSLMWMSCSSWCIPFIFNQVWIMLYVQNPYFLYHSEPACYSFYLVFCLWQVLGMSSNDAVDPLLLNLTVKLHNLQVSLVFAVYIYIYDSYCDFLIYFLKKCHYLVWLNVLLVIWWIGLNISQNTVVCWVVISTLLMMVVSHLSVLLLWREFPHKAQTC